VARILFEIEKADLEWDVPLILLPKHKAKLFMNMLLIAAMSVPRGGQVKARLSGEAGAEKFEFSSKSDPEKRQKTLIPAGCVGLLSGMPEEGSVDARGIQPFYTGLLARMTDMDISIGIENDMFYLNAIPKAPVVAETVETVA
jgi:histidine phosphotransferase ChpT